jgi:hypothetical protein
LNHIPQAAKELAQCRFACISHITSVEAQVKSPPGMEHAMIWADTRVNGWQQVTRNTKDFSPKWAGIRPPYVI